MCLLPDRGRAQSREPVTRVGALRKKKVLNFGNCRLPRSAPAPRCWPPRPRRPPNPALPAPAAARLRGPPLMGRSRSARSSSRDSEGWGQPASVLVLAGSSGPSEVPDSQPPPGSSTASSGPPPRILLRGECSKAVTALSTPVAEGDPYLGQHHLKSIVVRHPPRSSPSPSGHGDGWTDVQSRKDRRASRRSQGCGEHAPRLHRDQLPSFNADAGQEAFWGAGRGLGL